VFEDSMRRRSVNRGLASAAASLVGLPTSVVAGPSTLRIGLAAPPTTLDPHLESTLPNNALAAHLFDSLVVNDAQLTSMPGLAASWRVLDDTHWRFTLREGVVFSDGTPLTVDDIVASFERAATIPSTVSFRTYTRSIKSVTPEGGSGLIIETIAPDPLLPNSVSRIRIISAKAARAPSSDFDNGKVTLGTGPFVLKDYVPGNRVALVRNARYWGTPPPWTEVILQIVTDKAARVAALLAGNVDLIEQMPYQGIARLANDPRFHVIRAPSTRLVYLGMDQFRAVSPFVRDRAGKPLPGNPLKDRRVRRALSLAIDRQSLVAKVMEGNAAVASQFLPQGAPGTSPAIEPVPHDPTGAKALLAEAGYPDGFQLTLHGPNDRYVNDAKIVQAVAQMLTRVGVVTQVHVMPWSMYLAKQGEFSLFLASWGANTGETSNPMLAIVATPDKSAGMGVANAGRYSNPDVDRLLLRAKQTLDDTTRNMLLAEASTLVFNDHAILPLHHEMVILGARTGIDYTPRADQATLALGVRPA
jgi:peptide/nickel transport system substrate-binding protein